jgi:hypothetical protein
MSIAYVTDGVTDLDSALFNPIIDRVNGNDGWTQHIRHGVYNVLDYSAAGDGVTDDTDAILAAITAANKAGGSIYSTGGTGVVYLPAGVYCFSDHIDVPDFVQLRGSGPRTTILKATHADAGLEISGSSGVHGGFFLDGDDVGQDGLYLPVSNENLFYSIYIRNWTRYGVLCENLQNATFIEVNPEHNGDTGLVLDNQTSSNHFLRCEFAFNDVQQLHVKKLLAGNVNSNKFDTCIFEHTASDCQVLITAGTTVFENTIFASPGGTGKPLVQVGPKDDGASNCTAVFGGMSRLTGGVNDIGVQLNAGGIVVWADWSCAIAGASPAIEITDNTAFMLGVIPTLPGTGTDYNFTGTATREACLFTNFQEGQQVYQPAATTDRVLFTQVGSTIYHTLRGDGRMVWGDSGGLDTNLYRNAANVLKTDDKLIAALGLGVGNSAAATSLGSVTRKMEVFDASGASLGFVPLYDAIT